MSILMPYDKIETTLCLLTITLFLWLGCGEEEGTLVLELDTSKDIRQAVVRVDGEETVLDLARGQGTSRGQATFQIDLVAGGHVIGVDFKKADGKVVYYYGAKIVEIEAGKREIIPVITPSDDLEVQRE